jgi:uncharacterized Fe-S radical SAM superfamily protein PflX
MFGQPLKLKVRRSQIMAMGGCKVACVYCLQHKISYRYFDEERMMEFDDFKIYLQKVPRKSRCILLDFLLHELT